MKTITMIGIAVALCVPALASAQRGGGAGAGNVQRVNVQRVDIRAHRHRADDHPGRDFDVARGDAVVETRNPHPATRRRSEPAPAAQPGPPPLVQRHASRSGPPALVQRHAPRSFPSARGPLSPPSAAPTRPLRLARGGRFLCGAGGARKKASVAAQAASARLAIVARRRRVVVEGVVDVGIVASTVTVLPAARSASAQGRAGRVHPLVEAGEDDQHRRLRPAPPRPDRARGRRRRRRPSARRPTATASRLTIAAAPAEADDPDLARRRRRARRASGSSRRRRRPSRPCRAAPIIVRARSSSAGVPPAGLRKSGATAE